MGDRNPLLQRSHQWCYSHVRAFGEGQIGDSQMGFRVVKLKESNLSPFNSAERSCYFIWFRLSLNRIIYFCF